MEKPLPRTKITDKDVLKEMEKMRKIAAHTAKWVSKLNSSKLAIHNAMLKAYGHNYEDCQAADNTFISWEDQVADLTLVQNPDVRKEEVNIVDVGSQRDVPQGESNPVSVN